MNLLNITKQLLADGGVVMWPLALASLVIWFLLFYRCLQLTEHRFCRISVLHKLGQSIAHGKSVESTDEFAHLLGVQRQLLGLLNHVEPDQLKSNLAQAVSIGSDLIGRNGSFVRCLIHVAPLLGLLGTVCGMITTFDVISIAGTSEPKLLAHGIGIAMLTTQAGLLIAVPAIFVERRINRWESKIIHGIEETRLVLMQCFNENPKKSTNL